MPGGTPWPRIAIVTPSYNQGRFLEETIRTVLLQGYPNLEYIIIDGDSTDDSTEIIRRYKPWLTYWETSKDEGQSDAIRKGVRRANGEWANWLNSDDFLLPGALATVGEHLSRVPASTQAMAFACAIVQEDGRTIEEMWHPRAPAGVRNFLGVLPFPVLPQPSTFVRLRSLHVRRDLHHVMDWALYFMLAERNPGGIAAADHPVAAFRRHDRAKTTRAPEHFMKEVITVIDNYPFRRRGDRRTARAYSRKLKARQLLSEERVTRGRTELTSLLEVVRRFPGAVGDRFFWGAVKRWLLCR